jgi:hypothetical protein
VGKWVTSKYTRDAVAGAAFSAAAQKAITDEIDWKQVAKSAAISVVAGKISRKILGVPDFSGGQCFTEDTLIIVKNGAKLIKDIEIGDEVYSANPETGEKGLKKVTNVFVSETNVLVHVFTGNEEIRTTLGHPFWVEGKGWIDAAYLEAGDKLRTYDGELVEIVKVKLEYLDEVIKVYNFEVEDWHTYFVSSTELLVHNMCDPKLRVGSEGTRSTVLDNANFAQKTYSSTFSKEGIKIYSDLAGKPINTVDDLADALKNGIIKPQDVPIDYIIRDGNTLILNTRSSQALTQAGILRSQWNAVNRTGNQLFEDMLTGQLSRNGLTSAGTPTVRMSGGNK